VTYEDSGRNRPNLWGDRYYFSGSVKAGEPYVWLRDNMPPGVSDLTPKTVFNGKWDPEARLAEIKAQIGNHETRSITP
jgi:pectinesterase